MKGSKPRALIVKFGAIGDVVMAIPAVHALHRSGYAIDWICGAAVAPLLACYPWIRVVRADDKAILKGSFPKRVRALTVLWREVAGERYELCATLYYDSRYKLIALPVRARRKLMLSRTQRDLQLIASRHHTDEYARVLLGQEDSCRPNGLSPLRPNLLPISTLPERRRPIRIGMVPGGASNMLRQQNLRRWPANRYAEVAKIMLDQGHEVVLLGGPEDTWVRPEFAGLDAIDAIGALSLPEVISACDSCDLVISHDTGPLHLASLSTAALIALFGPTDPGNFLPRRPGVHSIWGGAGFACRPCYDGRGFAPCSDNGCMQQISIDMVLQKVEEVLQAPAALSSSDPLLIIPSNLRAQNK